MLRVVLFVALAGLGGCGSAPGALGLTGAPLATPPEIADDSVIRAPGVPGGGAYNATVAPTTGPGRYYGY
ncbi:MAG TPA: hypothetical protein VFW75_14420 [Acetobacteraceae bacterium]|nr:hypothetical protein [Acetobacteraceae bacterium]